jgi:hypothetical protein
MVKNALLTLLSILCVSGCASSRVYDVAGDSIQFQEEADFYIVVPELTEKVTYNFFGNPFDYSKRAPGRQMVDAKPDVPDEISKYLTELGHHVELGPELTPGSNADYSVTYQELWGWDLRPIIKMLQIEICDTNSARCASCTFEEMTFFNSQPTARSVVPRMLDELFPEDSSHR